MGTKLIIHLHINGHTEFLQKEQAENNNTEIDEQQSRLITVCLIRLIPVKRFMKKCP